MNYLLARLSFFSFLSFFTSSVLTQPSLDDICSISYFLIERKILGYSQLRKGPNKVRLANLQPFNDAIELFRKENTIPGASNKLIFLLRPAIAISLSLLVFLIFPANEKIVSTRISMLFIYTVLIGDQCALCFSVSKMDCYTSSNRTLNYCYPHKIIFWH